MTMVAISNQITPTVAKGTLWISQFRLSVVELSLWLAPSYQLEMTLVLQTITLKGLLAILEPLHGFDPKFHPRNARFHL